MEVRALTAEDASMWWHLRLEGLVKEPFAFGRSVAEHELTTIESAAIRFREMPAHSFTLGAFEHGALIGIATFLRDTDDKQRHKGRIVGVYVSAVHQRKGVGKALMDALIGEAKADPSLEQILLTVTDENEAAYGLYRKLGFEDYGTEPRALKIGSDYADMHHMVLRVR